MIRYRQRNTAWLTILGALTGIAVIGGIGLSPVMGVALLGMFGGAVAGSFIQINPARSTALVGALQQRAPVPNKVRVSAQAREAVTRASSRGSAEMDGITLMDVGMIVASSGDQGLVMRRARSISKDDDGVRPFITLLIEPYEADRNARLRFEMIDQNGREQYIHEMNVYLRDGEVSILADHHLPLLDNAHVEGMGDWDVRITLDGRLIGLHSFTLTPSLSERRNRLGGAEQRARRYIIPEPEAEADVPVSLEDLLRDENNQNRSSYR